jgi:hypothetical protein
MRPLRPERTSSASQVPISKDVVTTSLAACTVACTSEAESVNGYPESTNAAPSTAGVPNDATLAALTAVLLGLDPTARVKLAAMLLATDKRLPE